MWVDSVELAKGPGSLLTLAGVSVQTGPAIALFDDEGRKDPDGKRCDMGLYTGLYGTQPKDPRERRKSPGN